MYTVNSQTTDQNTPLWYVLAIIKKDLDLDTLIKSDQ